MNIANSFVAGVILGTIAENFIIIMNKSDMTPTDNTFKLKVKRKKISQFHIEYFYCTWIIVNFSVSVA